MNPNKELLRSLWVNSHRPAFGSPDTRTQEFDTHAQATRSRALEEGKSLRIPGLGFRGLGFRIPGSAMTICKQS